LITPFVVVQWLKALSARFMIFIARIVFDGAICRGSPPLGRACAYRFSGASREIPRLRDFT